MKLTPIRKEAQSLKKQVLYYVGYLVGQMSKKAVERQEMPKAIEKFLTDGFVRIGNQRSVYVRHVVKSYYVTVNGKTGMFFSPNKSVLKQLFGTNNVSEVPVRFCPKF